MENVSKILRVVIFQFHFVWIGGQIEPVMLWGSELRHATENCEATIFLNGASVAEPGSLVISSAFDLVFADVTLPQQAKMRASDPTTTILLDLSGKTNVLTFTVQGQGGGVLVDTLIPNDPNVPLQIYFTLTSLVCVMFSSTGEMAFSVLPFAFEDNVIYDISWSYSPAESSVCLAVGTTGQCTTLKSGLSFNSPTVFQFGSAVTSNGTSLQGKLGCIAFFQSSSSEILTENELPDFQQVAKFHCSNELSVLPQSAIGCIADPNYIPAENISSHGEVSSSASSLVEMPSASETQTQIAGSVSVISGSFSDVTSTFAVSFAPASGISELLLLTSAVSSYTESFEASSSVTEVEGALSYSAQSSTSATPAEYLTLTKVTGILSDETTLTYSCITSPSYDISDHVCYCSDGSSVQVSEDVDATVTADETSAKYASELVINVEELSSSRRKLNSATDDRPSSSAIGSLGVGFCVVAILTIVIFDLVNLVGLLSPGVNVKTKGKSSPLPN